MGARVRRVAEERAAQQLDPLGKPSLLAGRLGKEIKRVRVAGVAGQHLRILRPRLGQSASAP